MCEGHKCNRRKKKTHAFRKFFLNIELVDPKAKMPGRANPSDAGCDVYSPGEYKISPRGDVLIPLGWRCEFPEGYVLYMAEKSGVATKLKLDIGACLHGDEKVWTTSGLISVKDLTIEHKTKEEIKILSYNRETNEIELSDFEGFRISKTTECFELTFDDGSTIKCSEDHRFLTTEGWIKANELNELHELIIPDQRI